MPADTPRFASLHDPTIAAIADGLFRLRTQEDARRKLKNLPIYFSVSRKHPITPDSLVLWVKGYALTPEDIKEGYLGHYARVTCESVQAKWTLKAEKLPIALKNHPQRKYLTQSPHPNWGHPILRHIKQKKPFASPEEAQERLMALHEQYPDASIPGNGKLYLMIYGKPPIKRQTPAQTDAPIHKYLLTVRTLEEGGCLIDCTFNDRRKKTPPQKPTPPAGFFSSMVKFRRGGKKTPRPVPSSTKQSE